MRARTLAPLAAAIVIGSLLFGCALRDRGDRSSTPAGSTSTTPLTLEPSTIRPETESSSTPIAKNTPPCLGDTFATGPRFELDGVHAWVVCNGVAAATTVSKRIFRSDDGGRTWQLVAQSGFAGLNTPPAGVGLAPAQPIHDVFFVDSRNGWIGVSQPGPGLFQTHDGGVTWIPIRSLGPEADVSRVRFSDLTHGEVQSRLGIWDTNDGGETWMLVATPTPTPFHTPIPSPTLSLIAP
jgi:photosystem II stability/assembly factor-like uncharacterized protein